MSYQTATKAVHVLIGLLVINSLAAVVLSLVGALTVPLWLALGTLGVLEWLAAYIIWLIWA